VLERCLKSSAAHAPFLSAASVELLNRPSFKALDPASRIGKIFGQQLSKTKWKKSFRRAVIRKYVCIIAARSNALAVRPRHEACGGTYYDEAVDGTDPLPGISGGCGIRVGISVTHASRTTPGCSIRGVEGGGWVEDSFPHVSDRRGRCTLK